MPARVMELVEGEDVSRIVRGAIPIDEALPITSPAMTQAGMILGTAAYMSPGAF